MYKRNVVCGELGVVCCPFSGAGCERGHEQLHLVHKVASLHLAPVHLLVGAPQVGPLGVLHHLALGLLLVLTAGELHQNLTAALRPVTHWGGEEMRNRETERERDEIQRQRDRLETER